MSVFDVNYTFQRGYEAALNERKGKGWEEVHVGPNLFDYIFRCKDCKKNLPKGFVVSPQFCPYCGKQHANFS